MFYEAYVWNMLEKNKPPIYAFMRNYVFAGIIYVNNSS